MECGLFEKILPRHLEIIYQINHWFLTNEVEAKWPNDDAMKRDLSIIQRGEGRSVRMAYLSVVASNRVNGVAALHTELLKRNLSLNLINCTPINLLMLQMGSLQGVGSWLVIRA